MKRSRTEKAFGMLALGLLFVGLALATGCDNPFKSDGTSTPGESTQTEDDIAISNYVYNITVSGDRNNVNVGDGTIRTQDDHSTQVEPPQDTPPATP